VLLSRRYEAKGRPQADNGVTWARHFKERREVLRGVLTFKYFALASFTQSRR